MAKFFPMGQIMGFVFSLVLTVIAMLVYYTDMSFTTGMVYSFSDSIHSSRFTVYRLHARW